MLGLHARLKAAQHACGKHHHEPEHGLRAMVRKSAHLGCEFQRRGEAKAVDGGKPEQRGNRHRSGHAVRSTSAANTESAWAVRSWPKLVSSNTAGIAARASSAFAASDMSDVSSASHPSRAKKCRDEARVNEAQAACLDRVGIAGARSVPAVQRDR